MEKPLRFVSNTLHSAHKRLLKDLHRRAEGNGARESGGGAGGTASYSPTVVPWPHSEAAAASGMMTGILVNASAADGKQRTSRKSHAKRRCPGQSSSPAEGEVPQAEAPATGRLQSTGPGASRAYPHRSHRKQRLHPEQQNLRIQATATKPMLMTNRPPIIVANAR